MIYYFLQLGSFPFSQKRATDVVLPCIIILLLRFQTSILIGITELSENFVLRGTAVIETKFWEEFRKIFSCILLVFHTVTEKFRVELDISVYEMTNAINDRIFLYLLGPIS